MIRQKFIQEGWIYRIRLRQSICCIAAVNSKTGRIEKIRIPLKLLEDANYDLFCGTMEEVIKRFGGKHKGLIDQEYYTFPY